MKIALSFAVTLLFALAVNGQKLEPPKLDPAPSTESQRALIQEGVALHDKGDYDAAISRYGQVLKENPNNVEAWYEMAYSYFAKKDYQKSIEAASKAAMYRSDLLAPAYVQIGTAFDDLGNSKQAIDVYKAGIKLASSSGLLYYNLAITYMRTGQLEEGRAAAKKAAGLDPTHHSSQILLNTLFEKSGYQIPALLAACRFLVLEPATARSEAALRSIEKIMGAGVYRKSEKEISIVVNAQQKKR